MATEAQRMACRRYYARSKKFTRAYLIRLNKVKDADVIAKLDDVPSKAEYIRELVRRDICGD